MKPGFPNYDWQRKRGQVTANTCLMVMSELPHSPSHASSKSLRRGVSDPRLDTFELA